MPDQMSLSFDNYPAQRAGAVNRNGRRRYPVAGRPVHHCRSCGACIVFVPTGRGSLMPCNLDGETHFATCPHARQHRKRDKSP